MVQYQALTQKHTGGLLELSLALRSDPSPCSFWCLTDERVSDWLEDPNRHAIVGSAGTDIVGIGALQCGGRHQQHLGEISVAVHPDHRRSGIAASLVSRIEKEAQATSIEIIRALIWVENGPSRRLFESLGYEHKATLMAEFKNETIGEIDDAVYYKRLSEAPPNQ